MKTTRRTLLRWSVAGCAALVAVSAGVTCAQTQVVTADRISMAEFKKLHASGSVLVVDVRDADSFKLGHIPGAILVPLEQVSARARELKAVKKPIVTYCA
jgi:predicted sulfurtransferase